MKILVIGSGGREHALCWKMAKSKKVDKIYCAPGNGGTGEIAENIEIKANAVDELVEFALEKQIDLTVVGPEDPLVMGIVDKFQAAGLKIFGPNRQCAKLEGSKEFSKVFMEKHGIPTAKYRSYTEYENAVKGLDEFTFPLVIKADGLCMGKGVIICNDYEVAISTLDEILNQKIFEKEGQKIIIEEYLDGVEASLLCFVTDGKIFPMESAKDYKKILDHDLGPNTGGIGAYSPSPLFTSALKNMINRDILDKIAQGLKNDQLDFKGILFIGFMIKENEVKVLEFNVRFGDPETQVLMPRLESDLVDLCLKTIDGTLEGKDLTWTPQTAMTLVLTSKGYPGKYQKDSEIKGLGGLDQTMMVFHNGTRFHMGKWLTSGGRVMSLTSLGDDLNEAREHIYGNVNRISFEGVCYRKDIGD